LFLGTTARSRSCFSYCCFSVGVPRSVLCTCWSQCLFSKHTKHWAAKTVTATVNKQSQLIITESYIHIVRLVQTHQCCKFSSQKHYFADLSDLLL
jgi:hypothetical protein